jgi:hypothetical protein
VGQKEKKKTQKTMIDLWVSVPENEPGNINTTFKELL